MRYWIAWIDKDARFKVRRITRGRSGFEKLMVKDEIRHADALAIFPASSREDALEKAQRRVGAVALNWQEAKVWSRGQWAPIDIN